MTNKSMIVITVNVPTGWIAYCKELVEGGIYASRSCVVRAAMMEFFENHRDHYAKLIEFENSKTKHEVFLGRDENGEEILIIPNVGAFPPKDVNEARDKNIVTCYKIKKKK